MKTSNLIRWSGPALMIGGILGVVGLIIHPLSETASDVVSSLFRRTCAELPRFLRRLDHIWSRDGPCRGSSTLGTLACYHGSNPCNCYLGSRRTRSLGCRDCVWPFRFRVADDSHLQHRRHRVESELCWMGLRSMV